MTKLDKPKAKQQLFHLSISLATILVCMTYMQHRHNWEDVGSFWNSLIVPIIFTGELLKVVLAHYYGRLDQSSTPLQKQRQKKVLSRMTRELFAGLLIQVVCTLFYAFMSIILGAPVLHKYEQTFVLALILTIFTVTPTVFLLGGSGALQICFCENIDFLTKSEVTALELYKYNAVGALVGAWAGTIVAPLDWDVDWQVYPIPNVIGALLGSALGNIWACSRVLYGTVSIIWSKKRA